QPNGFQLEFERVARSFRLVHLLDSPCLSLNAQQGIRFSGASSGICFHISISIPTTQQPNNLSQTRVWGCWGCWDVGKLDFDQP
ncbi:hypothetical protein, partial [Burkholderia multivorans]|uniref:hypothetical protein n=1 Tax=Burkholderia multivorans TaxID=87883 RepID=UPI001C23C37C